MPVLQSLRFSHQWHALPDQCWWRLTKLRLSKSQWRSLRNHYPLRLRRIAEHFSSDSRRNLVPGILLGCASLFFLSDPSRLALGKSLTHSFTVLRPHPWTAGGKGKLIHLPLRTASWFISYLKIIKYSLIFISWIQPRKNSKNQVPCAWWWSMMIQLFWQFSRKH